MVAAYLCILGAVVLERLFEVVVSTRNARQAFEQGGKEYGKAHYPAMVVLHTGFLFACAAEVLLLDRAPTEAMLGAGTAGLGLTMGLRYWAISTLGSRWNTRIIVVPGRAAVAAGPYRFFRHPNYVAVVLELAVLPLMGGAWITALVFGLLNAWMLAVRIPAEEAALREAGPYLDG